MTIFTNFCVVHKKKSYQMSKLEKALTRIFCLDNAFIIYIFNFTLQIPDAISRSKIVSGILDNHFLLKFVLP